MPFINSKVSVSLTKDKIERIKEQLGEAITIIPGKSENWLMVGFEDNYNLYFQGNQDQPSAFVEVNNFGKIGSACCEKLTARICDILQTELSIPKKRIYVKYVEVSEWGWNGSNL